MDTLNNLQLEKEPNHVKQLFTPHHMPPLSFSDLPPNPAPYDGKSELLVLAYPMSERHILWWARKHNIQHPSNCEAYKPFQRMGDAVLRMRRFIPSEWNMATVRFEDGDNSFAWAFVSNSENDLKLANNLESIEKVRKIIGARGPPQWYEREY